MVGRVFSDSTIQLVISADTADYNIFTSAGSPSGAANVTLTIASGVVVYQNAGSAAIRTGSFAGTATVTIVNRGTVVGKGGGGGAGGASTGVAGTNGSAGGVAIYRDTGMLRIDNTLGNIFGGGGGGGGGEGRSGAGGGGGGGGRGRISSSGGAGGTGAPAGSAGVAGDVNGAGAGGAAGAAPAQDGGDGADWGDTGEAGGAFILSPSTGGAAGYALRNASGNITWLGGLNSSQVKGQIS